MTHMMTAKEERSIASIIRDNLWRLLGSEIFIFLGSLMCGGLGVIYKTGTFLNEFLYAFLLFSTLAGFGVVFLLIAEFLLLLIENTEARKNKERM